MIDYADLAKNLRIHRVKSDEEMPAPYRKGKRDRHDDWGIRGVSKKIQPWTLIPRRWTAFRVPMPFRKVAGNQEPKWTPYDGVYPLAPGARLSIGDYFDGQQVVKIPHVLTMHSVYDSGWSLQEAYINGAWRTCFYTSSQEVAGKRLTVYQGLRLEAHPDTMAWFPEASISWKKVG